MAEKKEELKETRALRRNWSVRWYRIREFLWKFFGALFLEEKGEGKRYAVSLGRIVFLTALGYLIYLWTRSLQGVDLPMPAGLLEVFYTLAGYVFGTKVVEAVRRR